MYPFHVSFWFNCYSIFWFVFNFTSAGIYWHFHSLIDSVFCLTRTYNMILMILINLYTVNCGLHFMGWFCTLYGMIVYLISYFPPTSAVGRHQKKRYIWPHWLTTMSGVCICLALIAGIELLENSKATLLCLSPDILTSPAFSR